MSIVSLQEKKGQEQMKPGEKEAQKREQENAKFEKILNMVRSAENKDKKWK